VKVRKSCGADTGIESCSTNVVQNTSKHLARISWVKI